jgi:hypothetical protein
MRPVRKMTAAEFEALRPWLDMKEDRIKAARAVLVEGKTLQAASDEFGWTRQSSDDAVKTVLRALARYRISRDAEENAGKLLPPGWEQVILIAPSHLIAKFRGEIDQAAPQPVKKAEPAKKLIKQIKKPGA